MDKQGHSMPVACVRFSAKAVLSYVIIDANLLSRVSRSYSCRGNCSVLYQNHGFHVDKLDLESEHTVCEDGNKSGVNITKWVTTQELIEYL